ncbi:DUF5688 family protein [Anaerostipes sp.]|uniref:DUF5688 family protein n=1 Tax=Anaerostipes sp. TaxID=1872530 RepID=UPI002588E9DB|nr:DUF5688 family protein [Anaerostipes sp.]MCI5622268.1 DUF5688 family protein [Anaerostipes sp.]
MKEEMIKRAAIINQLLAEKEYGFRIEYESILKNNCRKDVYQFYGETKYHNVLPLLNYDESWWNMSDTELVEFLRDIYIEKAFHLDDKMFFTREYILERVLPKIVSIENENAFQKEKVICVPILDMIVTFYLPIKDSEAGLLSIKITEEFLQTITFAELKNAAISNAEKSYRIETMDSVLYEMGTDVSNYSADSYPMYILTNESRINGAATILSQNIMWDLSRQMDTEDIILLPSSIHEFIALPFSEDLEFAFLLEMVKHANETTVNLEDKLTDSVYVWHSGKFTVLR